MPVEADEILAQLSKIRLDKKQVYSIRDITIRRDVLTFALNRGAIAFLEPVKGKVTGAVFIGTGEIVAIPPDAIEKQQVHKFTGTPILNEPFQAAVFRFTDNTYEEITKEISQRAHEDLSPEELREFDSWDTTVARRSPTLDLRLLADLLEPGKPLFLAELNGDNLGPFNAALDLRAIEEVSIFKVQQVGSVAVADIWGSFNQRSEARRPEAVAHEDKSPIEILSYEVEGSNAAQNRIEISLNMRLKVRDDGIKTLNLDIASGLRVASLQSEMGEPVAFYQRAGSLLVLVPPVKAAHEFSLRFKYAGDASSQGAWYPSQRQQKIPSFKSNLAMPATGMTSALVEYMGHKVAPASYHDLWLVEGLTRYIGAMSSNGSDPAGPEFRKLLTDARDGIKALESAGPIWLGQRLFSTVTPDAYRVVQGKGLWVIHMLRMMLRQDGPNPDSKFLAMLDEFARGYDGRAASTWDFKNLAEKYADSNLDWFFDQWVFSTGLPSFTPEYRIESSANEFTIDGTVTQSGVPDGFIAQVPVYADDEYLGTVTLGDSDGRFRFRTRKKPDRIVLDPHMSVLNVTLP